MATGVLLELVRDWVSSAPSAFRGSTPSVPAPAARRICGSLALLREPAPRGLQQTSGGVREPATVPAARPRFRRVSPVRYRLPRVLAGGRGGGPAALPAGSTAARRPSGSS